MSPRNELLSDSRPLTKAADYRCKAALESRACPLSLAFARQLSQRESLYEWMVGKMIFTAKKPFWLSVVRVPLYFWTMRFVTLTA